MFDCDGTMALLSNKELRIGDGRDDDYTRDFLQTTNVNWELIKREKGIFSSITLSLKGKRM